MTSTAGWYPAAVRKPLSKRVFRSMSAPKRINLHTAVSNGSSLHSMFNRGGVASHFYVREDGTVEQYVSTRQRAACDLDGNPDTISIETWDGYPNGWRNDSDVPAWNPRQVSALVALLQWVWRTHPTVPRKRATDNRRAGTTSHGLSYHRLGVPGYARYSRAGGGLLYSSSRGKVCPGDRRIGQIGAIYAAAVSGSASAGNPAAPAPTTPTEDIMTPEQEARILDAITTQRRTVQIEGLDRSGIDPIAKTTAEKVAAMGFERPIIERNAEAAARHTGVILDAKLAALRQAEQDIRAHGVDEDLLARIEAVAHRGALSGAKAGTEQALDSLEATVTIGTKEA